MNTGKENTEGKFLPAEPNLASLLDQLGAGKGGWGAINGTAAGQKLEQSAASKERDELRRRYFQMAKEYQDVMEDMLDNTLRCAPCHPGNEAVSLEAQTAYALVRQGQNGFMTYILNMIHLGKNVVTKKSTGKTSKT